MRIEKNNKLIIISSPSGAGKTTLCKLLIKKMKNINLSISYVGKKTLDIIFENYKSDFLFYFFNNSLNRHIFSKTYNDHIKKLNEFRNN